MLRLQRPGHGHRRPRHVRMLWSLMVIGAVVAACAGSGASGTAPEAQRPGSPADGKVAATAAPAPAGYRTGANAPGSAQDTYGGDGSLALADLTTGPLLVRTGDLDLEVSDIDAALLQARARIVGLGGYVSDSERSNAGDQSMALITYRIPAARWDDAMDALRGLATTVRGEQTRAADVTGQVVDLGARIDNLRATEAALQAIMARATKISDVLDVQNQLTGVRGQIEQLSAQLAHVSDQAALGTLAVTYSLPVAALAKAGGGWDLAQEIDRAMAQLVIVGQGIAVAGVWLAIVGVPVLLGLLLVAWLAITVVRRLGVRRPVVAAGSDLPAVPS